MNTKRFIDCLTRSLLVLLVACVCCIPLAGCSATQIAAEQANIVDPPAPEKTVNRFIDAANDMDVNGMLDCCDRSTREAYGLIVRLLGMLLNGIGIPGVDFNSLLSNDTVSELSGYTKSMGYSYNITITDMSVDYSSDRLATVRCGCRLTTVDPLYEGEITQEDVLVVNLVLEDGDWKIDATEDLLGSLVGNGR